MARNIVRGFLSIFSANLGLLFLTIAITPIVVRVLGSSGYGDYAVLLSILGIIMTFVNAGVFDGVRKYIAESRDAPDWQASVFSYYLRFAAVLALIAVLVMVILTYSGLIQRVFGPQYDVYFYILSGLVVAQQFSSLARGTLMGLGYEHFSEPLRLTRKVLFAAIGIPLAFIGFGVTGVLIGRLAARILTSVVAYALIFRQIPMSAITKRLSATFPHRELISFNSMSVLLTLCIASLYNVDVLLLKVFMGSETTGYYKAALVTAEFIWFVPKALQVVLMHSTSELWSDQNVHQITELASRATRYALLLTVLLAIGIAALADAFVPLYFGDEFVPAITPLLFLLPGTIGLAVSRPMLAIGQGKGSLHVLVYATGAAALINVVLNIALIPRFGMVGAAIGTSVGYGSMLLFHTRSARLIGFDPVGDLRLGRITVTAVPAAAVIFLLAELASPPLLSLIVVPPVGFLVYATLAIYVGAVDGNELTELIDHLPINRVPFSSPD